MSINKVASGTVWLTAMQVIDNVIAFIFFFIIARLLEPADVGSLSLLFSITAVYNTLTMFALNNAAIKFISQHYARGEEDLASSASRQILRLTLIISAPSLMVSFILSPILSGWLNVSIWSCIAILSASFLMNLANSYGGVMFGLSLFKQVSLQNMIYYLTSRFPALFLVIE